MKFLKHTVWSLIVASMMTACMGFDEINVDPASAGQDSAPIHRSLKRKKWSNALPRSRSRLTVLWRISSGPTTFSILQCA